MKTVFIFLAVVALSTTDRSVAVKLYNHTSPSVGACMAAIMVASNPAASNGKLGNGNAAFLRWLFVELGSADAAPECCRQFLHS